MAAAFHEGVCNDYFVINPEKASLFDLVSLLISPRLENRRFIDCSGSGWQRRSFRHRWSIFVSVVVQKLLLWATKPMAFVGDAIEMWLNLLSANVCLFHLLLTLAKGKIVWPQRLSATFASCIGHTDIRTALDQNIRANDAKYKAALSVMVSKISYENQAFIEAKVTQLWKMKFVKFYNFRNDYKERDSTQAFILQDTVANPNLFVVGFRGTSPFDADDWRTDADLSWYNLKAMGDARAHSGFMQALGLQKNKGWPKEIEQDNNAGRQFAYYTLREKLREVLKENEGAKFILTGHSLGGALAILFPSVLMLHEEKWLLDRLDGVYTFGQPRVGDERFGEFMKANMGKFDVKYFRYVYCNDMVPRVPYDDKNTLFKHFGPCLFFNSFYVGKVLPEEPNKNYFSLLWMIPKVVNAVWELNRGFILPYVYGSNYKEGWFLRLLRLTGVLIPGLSAHSPQDYVNCTQIGTMLDHQLRVHQLTRYS